MKPLYFFIIMLVGIGLIALDTALQMDKPHDTPRGLEKYSPQASKQEEPSRPLRIIGVIITAAGGISFAIWKATYFFEVTGRHRY